MFTKAELLRLGQAMKFMVDFENPKKFTDVDLSIERKLRQSYQEEVMKEQDEVDRAIQDACGEEREIDMNNPYKPGEYK
jgi:hypothetical protein